MKHGQDDDGFLNDLVENLKRKTADEATTCRVLSDREDLGDTAEL